MKKVLFSAFAVLMLTSCQKFIDEVHNHKVGSKEPVKITYNAHRGSTTFTFTSTSTTINGISWSNLQPIKPALENGGEVTFILEDYIPELEETHGQIYVKAYFYKGTKTGNITSGKGYWAFVNEDGSSTNVTGYGSYDGKVKDGAGFLSYSWQDAVEGAEEEFNMTQEGLMKK